MVQAPAGPSNIEETYLSIILNILIQILRFRVGIRKTSSEKLKIKSRIRAT